MTPKRYTGFEWEIVSLHKRFDSVIASYFEMNRYFLYFSYDGTDYHGWQIQPNGITVQQIVQEALTLCLRIPVEIVGAGRTDAGVHATRMVAHFDTEHALDTEGMVNKLNRILPQDIAIHKLVKVRSDAHARFTAHSRTYQYYLCSRKHPFRRKYVYRHFGNLDFDKMNEAAATLSEYTDFTSFSKLHTDVKTNNCQIRKAFWQPQEEDIWVFTIQADRFLRNMVRAVVGTLLEVGRGKLTVEGFRKVIEEKNRCAAGTSVPGHALFLVEVGYPDSIFETDT